MEAHSTHIICMFCLEYYYIILYILWCNNDVVFAYIPTSCMIAYDFDSFVLRV